MPPKYPNGVITQYSVQYDGINIPNFGKNNVSNKIMGTIEGLLPDTDYVFELKAYTRGGPGPPTSVAVKTCKLLGVVVHYK